MVCIYQGVTQDDVKAAELTLKKAEKPELEKSESQSSVLASASSSSISQSDDKQEEASRPRRWQRVSNSQLSYLSFC